jgi:menaquinone-specific isochorismate synthase
MYDFQPIKTQLLDLLQRSSHSNSPGYLRLEQSCGQGELLAWLSVQKQDVKIYWADKDGGEESAMLGVCHQIYQVDTQERIAQARYYGGVGFDSHTSSWQNFAHCLFVLPRLEIKRAGKQWQIICNLDCRTGSLESEVKASLALLDQLQDPLKRSVPEVENLLLSRDDIPGKSLWYDLIEQFFDDAESQTIAKVVLSRKTSLKFAQPVDVWCLLARWKILNHNCYQFAFQFSPGQVFIGCSPERLYLRSGSRLTTEALAGTALRGNDEQQDQEFAASLQQDPKLRRENTLVREDILSRLEKLSLDIGVDEASVLKLRHIQHLKQRIRAFLKPDVSDAILLKELHPTPAVGGSPRDAALDFILAHEPYDRGWYAGAVGYLSATQSEFSVAIRSALIEGDSVFLYAGAGIVNGSEAELEWQELDNKISTVLALLA